MALGMGGRALHDVDLSVEQRRQVRALVEAAKKDGLSDAMEELHASRRALERAVWNPDTGDAELSRLRAEIAGAEDSLLTLRRRLAGEVLRLLSEEQRQQLARALDERR
jgi:Spy/CpxP family protein refolding chaperone